MTYNDKTTVVWYCEGKLRGCDRLIHKKTIQTSRIDPVGHLEDLDNLRKRLYKKRAKCWKCHSPIYTTTYVGMVA